MKGGIELGEPSLRWLAFDDDLHRGIKATDAVGCEVELGCRRPCRAAIVRSTALWWERVKLTQDGSRVPHEGSSLCEHVLVQTSQRSYSLPLWEKSISRAMRCRRSSACKPAYPLRGEEPASARIRARGSLQRALLERLQ